MGKTQDRLEEWLRAIPGFWNGTTLHEDGSVSSGMVEDDGTSDPNGWASQWVQIGVVLAALRQLQDIEAAAREINRLWFDIEGTGSSSYAADAVREHGNEFVEAMWRLRAAIAPRAEEAPR